MSTSFPTLANATLPWDNGTAGNVMAAAINLPVAVVVGITLGCIVAMTIGGNVLVLLAVYFNSHLRSTTNYFIVNLAVADLLLGTMVLPLSASLEVVDAWLFGQIVCDVWAAIDVLCCTASILSLCVISIDRYIGVTRPLQHASIMSEKRAVLVIGLIWALSLLISVAPLIGWKDPPNPDPSVCTVTTQLGYVLFSVSGSFYIPMLIIVLVYCRIYREAVRHTKFLARGIKTAKDAECESVTLRIHTGGRSPQIGGLYQSRGSRNGASCKGGSKLAVAKRIAKFKKEKKAAKTLGIVVGVFILCWFPFFFILPLGKSTFTAASLGRCLAVIPSRVCISCADSNAHISFSLPSSCTISRAESIGA